MTIHKAPLSTGNIATAAADASDSGCNGAQLPEPDVLDSEPEDADEDMNGDPGVAALDEEVNQLLQLEKAESLTTHYCLCSHLSVKDPTTRRTMATVSRVLVALAPAHGTKGVIHSAVGRRSVYRQIYKE